MSADRDLAKRYANLTCIGRGQSSRVYRATDRSTGQMVALKALDRSGSTALFLQELSALVQLRHPNVVGCRGIEYGPTDRYLVMDYCAGGSLRDRLSKSIDPALIFDWINDILSGLTHIHHQGLLHCDLKPDNILLTGTAALTGEGASSPQGDLTPVSLNEAADSIEQTPIEQAPIGQTPTEKPHRPIARISDFGLVRGTLQGPFELGSPAYMAPERFDGLVSPASDLYAVGILLFELLSGDRPFHGSPAELRQAHRQEPIPPLPPRITPGTGGPIPGAIPSIPNSEWNAILQIALHKQPEHRFPSAEAFQEALRPLSLFMIL